MSTVTTTHVATAICHTDVSAITIINNNNNNNNNKCNGRIPQRVYFVILMALAIGPVSVIHVSDMFCCIFKTNEMEVFLRTVVGKC